MPPNGGLMMGAGRTVVNGATRSSEHLRLRARDDTLVFENLAHDFPQRILYRRLSADSVVARAEGPGANGAVRGFNIPMRRVECAPRPAP